MGASKKRELPSGMEVVRRRFEHWRRTHKLRSRIPDSLWAAAVKLVGRCGLHRTAQALRLDYYALKKRAAHGAGSVPNPDESIAASAFVELPAVGTVGSCECTLELEDRGGAKMRVHLKGIATPDLAALSQSFWK